MHRKHVYVNSHGLDQLQTTEKRIKTAESIFIKIYIQRHTG